MLETAACSELIGHAVALRWTEQIVNSLFPGEAIVPLSEVLAAAAKFGDKAFVGAAEPLSKIQLKAVAYKTLESYTDGNARRTQALDILAAVPDECVAGADGVYSGSDLVIRTSEPEALLRAYRIKMALERHPFYRELSPLATPCAFVEKIGHLLTAETIRRYGEQLCEDLCALQSVEVAVLRAQLFPASVAASTQSSEASEFNSQLLETKSEARSAECDTATNLSGPE